jgi:hypothetical protein
MPLEPDQSHDESVPWLVALVSAGFGVAAVGYHLATRHGGHGAPMLTFILAFVPVIGVPLAARRRNADIGKWCLVAFAAEALVIALGIIVIAASTPGYGE